LLAYLTENNFYSYFHRVDENLNNISIELCLSWISEATFLINKSSM